MADKLLYLYCLIPTSELVDDDVPLVRSINGQSLCRLKTFRGITAVVCDVDESMFSQEQLVGYVHDPEWLKTKGTLHHECIARFHQKYTVLPVSFCTIFADEDSLEKILIQEYPSFLDKFRYLDQKQEWNLRMYMDREKLQKYVEATNSQVLELQEEIQSATPGKQFFLRKKLEQFLASASDAKVALAWDTLRYELLRRTSAEVAMKDNWPTELTNRSQEMVANGVFLVPQQMVSVFRETIASYEPAYDATGLSFEYSGPWPPYHFASFAKEA